MRVKNSSHKFTWLLVHAKKSKMSKRYVEWWRLDRDLKINLVSLDSIDWWRFLFIRMYFKARTFDRKNLWEDNLCSKNVFRFFIFLSFHLSHLCVFLLYFFLSTMTTTAYTIPETISSGFVYEHYNESRSEKVIRSEIWTLHAVEKNDIYCLSWRGEENSKTA